VIPDEAVALELHAKYGSNPIIVEHCQTVARVANVLAAKALAKGLMVDARSVNAGALLHDIGRNRTQSVRHGLEGGELLELEGVDRKVVEIVKRHVGAGISPEEARRLGFPESDYVPRTLEERIVCFADKMVDSNKIRPFDGEVQRFIKKGHDLAPLLALFESLKGDLGEDPEKVLFDKIKQSS
jgi:uncharacterized protein